MNLIAWTVAVDVKHKLEGWIKSNWLLTALVALLFAAAMFEEGIANGAWFAAGACYLLAVRWFCFRAISAMALRLPLSWRDWSLLGFAAAFAALAYAARHPKLAIVGGLVGLILGAASGLLSVIYAPQRRQK
ncbi:hypothetical protein AB4059_01495 [Lysobacter sp. 2RAF19]